MKPVKIPFFLETQYRDYVWGGNRLVPGRSPVAEAWTVYDQNKILNGPLEGLRLAEASEIAGPNLLGKRAYHTSGTRFPLLIKILDCAQWLSLQVHPDDDLAVLLEGPGQYGKTEAWHFLETSPDAEILCGLKPGITHAGLEASIRQHSVLNQMQRFQVKAGDSIFIRPGMIHALGPGMLVYEVQQTSNWTYRVWDWDRPATPDRPLHIEKSLAAANPDLTGEIISRPKMQDGLQYPLISCNFFDMELLYMQSKPISLNPQGETFHVLTLIQGSAELQNPDWQFSLQPLQTILVPADASAYQLVSKGECQVLKAQVGTGKR